MTCLFFLPRTLASKNKGLLARFRRVIRRGNPELEAALVEFVQGWALQTDRVVPKLDLADVTEVLNVLQWELYPHRGSYEPCPLLRDAGLEPTA